MQERIIQLLEHEDEANVLLGLEMVKGWGYSDALLNHLMAIYLFCSAPYIRKTILNIMSENAPEAIEKLYMENWNVFGDYFERFYGMGGIDEKHLLNILDNVAKLECINKVTLLNLVATHTHIDLYDLSTRYDISLDKFDKTATIDSFDLNQNHKTTNAPIEDIGFFVNLTRLYLSYGKLSSLPHEVKKLRKLQYINLDNNEFTVLPEELFECSNLEYLQISSNQLKTLSPKIGKLKKLKGLFLDKNQLQILPEEIGELENLETLHLANNSIEFLPESIVNLPHLEELNLCNNNLTNLPPDFCRLKKLRILDLENNFIRSFPTKPNSWQNLRELDFRNNKLKIWLINQNS